MTIGKKLYASIAILAGLTVVLGVVAWGALTRIRGTVASSSVSTHKLALAGVIADATQEMVSTERAMTVRGLTREPDLLRRFDNEYRVAFARRRAAVDEFLADAPSETSRRVLGEIRESGDERAAAHEELLKLCGNGEGVAAAAVLNDKLAPMGAKSKKKADELSQIATDQVKEDVAADNLVIGSSIWLIVIGMVFCIAVSAAVSSIVRQIIVSLHGAVRELGDGASQIAAASHQVSASSQSLASGATEQAASIEETSASSEEINAMAQKNLINATGVKDLVLISAEQFKQTNVQLSHMVSAMNGINEASGKISKIIKTIDEIAFQTNILALNAAVEAARAGDAGAGFAVVADEVRSLAQRSAQAAKDTASLIEESVDRSSQGQSQLTVVATSIGRISDEFNRVKMLVDDVSQGSTEQSTGIGQIGRALSSMEQVTQGMAASAEETAAASEELNAQADSLNELMTRLNSMVTGSRSIGGHTSAMQDTSLLSPSRRISPSRTLKTMSAKRRTGDVSKLGFEGQMVEF